MPSSNNKAKQFVIDILTKFVEIKVLGAGEDEEIDSLEHVALFDKNQKLITSSTSWHHGIHHFDKLLL